MSEYVIKSHCHINTNRESDTFVGLDCRNEELTVNFPLGYQLSDSDSGIRKDILLLMRTLALASSAQNNTVNFSDEKAEYSSFPLQEYLFIISDFFSRGYYQERESYYSVSPRGKIDWKRTIKTQSPYIQGNNIVYLNYVTRQTSLKDAGYITEIHKYCVYESFRKIGWLFTSFTPQKPAIQFNQNLFVQILKSKCQQTFNDLNKQLFESMIAIISCAGNASNQNDFKFGTNRFEYVWEKMIDRTYGIAEKSTFFPKTRWHTFNGAYSNAKKSGGNYYSTKLSYLGNQYTGEVFRQYFSGKISGVKAGEMLQSKVDHLPRLESAFFRGVT